MYPGYKFKPLRKADKIKLREEKEREKEAMRREKELQKSGGREFLFPSFGKSVADHLSSASLVMLYLHHTFLSLIK